MSAREEFVTEASARFRDWLTGDRDEPYRAYEAVLTKRMLPFTLAALVEEHGLDEVLRMLGGNRYSKWWVEDLYSSNRCSRDMRPWWRFPTSTEGDDS